MNSAMSAQHVVKVVSGSVKLHNAQGGLVRSFGQGAVSAVVQGHEVHVVQREGKLRVYGLNGGLKRTL